MEQSSDMRLIGEIKKTPFKEQFTELAIPNR